MSTPSKSPPDDPVLEITTSILTEAAQRPWLAALLMRRKPYWLTRLAHLAQRVRDLPRHTRRTLRRKLASGLAAAALLLALAGPPQTVYAAGITVNGDGTVGTCSLADAITSANTDTATGYCPAGSDADTITLTVDVTLAAALPAVASDITIEGGGHTIHGDDTFTVLTVQSGGNLMLNQATISGAAIPGPRPAGTPTHNRASSGDRDSALAHHSGKPTHDRAGINRPDDASSGGIYNSGTLTVTNSTITGHTAGYGAGIFNAGAATVTDSTISYNTANYSGGGIANANGGDTTVTNSTLSGNAANNSTEGSANGGGMVNYGGTLLVQNSTISGNTALASTTYSTARGGGISTYSGSLTLTHSTIANNNAFGDYSSEGGGIHGAATISNSIVVSNTLGPVVENDCAMSLSSGGYNIESGESCGFDPNNAAGDQWDVLPDSLKLLPLANNGGPTWTHALDNGSVALEKIPEGANGCGTTFTTDQRGEVRPGTRNSQTTKMCEIGAWEAQIADPTAITLRDLTATTAASPSVIGAVGAAIAALGALVIGRRRATNRQRINR